MATTPSLPSTERKSADTATKPRRWDIWAIWAGIAFAFLFTTLIYVTAARLEAFPKLADQGPAWYYWKLAEPTALSHLTAWGFYLAHQLTLWGLIWYAQTHMKKYTPGLHRVNVIALAANAFFIGLHFLQTHVWYDGLAQDVSIFSSQGSVVVMLVWILLMENNRRGLFFGKKVPIGKRIIQFARKYHGYFFSWAIIYTFWYHPMEATNRHLIGFFYTFLLLLQGSLFLTRIHVNRTWTFVQEIIVLAHGTIVAIVQGNNMWPLFAFGFGGIFIITQMHGLGLKNWIKWLLLAFYVVAAIIVFSERGISKVWQLAAIPAIDYLAVAILALLIAGGLWVYDRWRGKNNSEITGAAV